jgi:hypothetical protein
MKYKIVVKHGSRVWDNSISKSKEHLLQKAESLSKKNPKWRVFVVDENTIV